MFITTEPFQILARYTSAEVQFWSSRNTIFATFLLRIPQLIHIQVRTKTTSAHLCCRAAERCSCSQLHCQLPRHRWREYIKRACQFPGLEKTCRKGPPPSPGRNALVVTISHYCQGYFKHGWASRSSPLQSVQSVKPVCKWIISVCFFVNKQTKDILPFAQWATYIYLCLWKTELMEFGNFRLFTANGKRKWQTYVFCSNRNEKWKFFFLGRQAINDIRRLVFQQMCP